MGRALVVAGAVFCASCAQLAGIDETNGGKRTGQTFALTRASIGATVVTAPQDLTGLTAAWLVPDADGTPTPVTPDSPAPGTWHVDELEPSPIQFTTPDGAQRIWDFPDDALTAAFAVLEHPAPVAADPAATFAVSMTLPVAYNGTDSFYAYTVGAWAERVFAAAELPPADGTGTTLALTYPVSSEADLAAAPIAALTTADAFVVLEYAGATLADSFVAPAFAQTGTDTVTGTMVAVTPDQTLAATVDIAGLTARFATMTPAIAAPAMTWSIAAAPGAAYGTSAGPQLTAAPVDLTGDGTLAATYGNPFAAMAWPATFTLTAQSGRVYTPVSASATPPSISLFGGTTVMQDAATTGPVVVAAGVPTAVALDAVPLTTDGVVVPAPTDWVALSVTADVATNTLYEFEVHDYVLSADGLSYTATTTLSTASAAPTISVPPSTFLPGHLYSIRATVVSGGFPGIATGNLADRALPISSAFLDSGAFTVEL
ncbi:MAG TPA: hypothetical protein VGM88_15335 [Kofleriaceae bacterium]|jgi:hypothetical protein